MLKKGISDIVVLLVISFFLVALSLVTLYGFGATHSEGNLYYFQRQAFFSCIAFLVGFLMFRFSYKALKSISSPLYFGAVFLLVIVLVLGDSVRGTVGWLDFGFVRLQPVEIVKVILIFFLASFFVAKRNLFGEGVRIVISCILTLVLVLLVLLQPDFGSSLILLAIWVGMLFVSDMKTRYVFSLLVIGIIVAGSSWFFLEDYQKNRILTTIRPETDAQGSGYNVLQSLVAIGSGGVMGKGIGNGSQSQLLFLPEKHTDFIFAAIVENIGLVGAIIILLFYAILLHRIALIAITAGDSFGFLIASGVYIMLFFQIVINVGMNIGIVPVTGIPLPLISYGGSSLIATALGLGMVANIAYQKRFSKEDDKKIWLDEGSFS
ncbi:MAG: rod shape-determining protein RodA [Candidatus Moranbacteria bacterium]|nr:rod shape-determining protein RodA [Candidatus Moranbacteria bacterium]